MKAIFALILIGLITYTTIRKIMAKLKVKKGR